MDKQKKYQEENVDSLTSGITNTSLQEITQRYGSAAKEHWIALEGIDYETGTKLKRSLNDVSKSKINPKYEKQNIQQQSGFSAEIKESARENADRIINRDSKRKVRTDDIGKVNDPLYDHQMIDANGIVISGSGSQMKFVGKNPQECLDKLMSSKYQKYRDANVPFEVPSDYYDGIHQEINSRIDNLEKQIQAAKQKGKLDVVKKKQSQIDELKRVKRNLKKSHVSRNEAIEARTNPKLSTAKDIHRISHQAGIQGAQYGSCIGGTISGMQNAISVLRGDKTFSEALKDTAVTTTKSAASGYITAYGSTALTSAMKNSSKDFIRTLSKTGIPSVMVSTAISSVDTCWQWMNGEITGTQCLERMGKNGASIMASTAYATVGQVLIPIPVVGGLIGGMVGYALASSCYGSLMNALKESQLAKEERIQIEKECELAIKAIRQYRQEISRIADEYLLDYRTTFENAFTNIKTAMQIGDIDGFISGVNQITKKLNGKIEFNTFDEFERRMLDSTPFKL